MGTIFESRRMLHLVAKETMGHFDEKDFWKNKNLEKINIEGRRSKKAVRYKNQPLIGAIWMVLTAIIYYNFFLQKSLFWRSSSVVS